MRDLSVFGNASVCCMLTADRVHYADLSHLSRRSHDHNDARITGNRLWLREVSGSQAIVLGFLQSVLSFFHVNYSMPLPPKQSPSMVSLSCQLPPKLLLHRRPHALISLRSDALQLSRVRVHGAPLSFHRHATPMILLRTRGMVLSPGFACGCLLPGICVVAQVMYLQRGCP